MQNPMANIVRSESELYPRREFTYQEIDGLAVCKKCHAVHQDKHWVLDDALSAELLEQPATPQVVCPGCQAVKRRRADGELTIRGPLAATKGEEIENLLRAEERREMGKNPLGRIISIHRHVDGMEVATTTQFLARHLGRCLHKAFGGDLVVDKLHREAFVRVRWVTPFEKA